MEGVSLVTVVVVILFYIIITIIFLRWGVCVWVGGWFARCKPL